MNELAVVVPRPEAAAVVDEEPEAAAVVDEEAAVVDEEPEAAALVVVVDGPLLPQAAAVRLTATRAAAAALLAGRKGNPPCLVAGAWPDLDRVRPVHQPWVVSWRRT
ncbi:MAG: hypothetical protein ACRD0L_06645 [Acidimicrobiales bacterium]